MEAKLNSFESASTPVQGVMRRVLLVNSQPRLLQLMKSTLDRNGYEVDTALSAGVAARLFLEQRHEVIVLDDSSTPDQAAPLCDLLSGLSEDQRPLTLLVSMDGSPRLDLTDEFEYERLEQPMSLRYLVARLAGHFGCY
jgi:DNA-binding response OmpR family regulator